MKIRKFAMMLSLSAVLGLTACGSDDSNPASDGGVSGSNSPLMLESSERRTDCYQDNAVGELIDERDGQVYKTVKICDQVWMAENLNFDGPFSSRCFKGLSIEEDDHCRYGRHYTWEVVMDGAGIYSENGKGCGFGLVCSPVYPVRGICPEGWHIPTSAEWDTLYLATGKYPQDLMAQDQFNWPYATNISGFSALPAGLFHPTHGDYEYVLLYAGFWSASEYDSQIAYSFNLSDNSRAGHFNIGSNRMGKDYGWSVRCLQDSK